MAKLTILSIPVYKGDRSVVLWETTYDPSDRSSLRRASALALKTARKLAITTEGMVGMSYGHSPQGDATIIRISKTVALLYRSAPGYPPYHRITADGTLIQPTPNEVAKAEDILNHCC